MNDMREKMKETRSAVIDTINSQIQGGMCCPDNFFFWGGGDRDIMMFEKTFCLRWTLDNDVL